MVERVEYDELGLFHENAEEYGLPYDGPPVVRRVRVEVAPGRHLSALVWKDDEPALVLLHGGAQNAHTWDTVALALDRPLVAVDLPGHGHSDGPAQAPAGRLGVEQDAADVALVVRQLAPAAHAMVGMSLGGLTAIALAARAPELVRKLVLVDVVPGITGDRARHITAFLDRPSSFASLDELLELTARFNPTRSLSSLRRGILHNAEQQEDGTWTWRWARHRRPAENLSPPGGPDHLYAGLWKSLTSITVPVVLVRGMREDSVLGDDDEEALLRRVPTAHVVHVADAGHSVQGDTPLELAAIIRDVALGEKG